MATHNAHSGNSTHTDMFQESMAILPLIPSAASDSHGGLPTKISIDDHTRVKKSPFMCAVPDDARLPSLRNGVSVPMDIDIDQWLLHGEGLLSPLKLGKDVDDSFTVSQRHSAMRDGYAATSTIPTIITEKPVFSLMCPDMNANKRNTSPSLDASGLKKPKLAHVHLRQLEFSDISDPALHVEVDDEGVPIGKACALKNLASERSRKQRVKETLYSLRAAVPKINKMDKASIVGDAIRYVQDLQKQVEMLEGDIQTLEACRHGCLEGALNSVKEGMDSMVLSPMSVPEHKILELDVFKVEEQTYHLKIQCKKAPGVLVQLTRVFEALGYEIINAILSSVSDHILNTIVMKVKNEEALEAEELKKMLLKVASKFGLSL